MIAVGDRLVVSADPQGLWVRAQQGGLVTALRLDSPLQAGRWHLLAVSMDAPQHRAQAWLATAPAHSGEGEIAAARGRLQPAAGGRSLGHAASPAGDPVLGPWQPGGPSSLQPARKVVRDPVLQTDLSGLAVGAALAQVPAALVSYEALAIRDHPLTDGDVSAVWQSRDYYAVHSLDTRAAGGRMNGWRGCPFLTFHAVSPGASGLGPAEDRASYVDGPVTTKNVIMLRRPTQLAEARSIQFMLVGPVSEASGLQFSSRLDPGMDGFFELGPAPFDAPTEPIGTLGPSARMLATGPTGLVRVMVSANSRGVRGTLPPQPYPEGFAHGFVQALLPQTAGVLMRPATIFDARGGWFGLDTSSSTPITLLVRPLHARDDQWADWTRFGSGTLPGVSRGPGPALSVSPAGVFALRCRPVDGSLLVADAPLVVRSTMLAYPGSSDLLWHPERGLGQDGDGLALGGEQLVELDTTRLTHLMTASDRFESDTRLVLQGDVDVREADAMVVASGSALGAVSVVVAVERVDDSTAITLSHAFGLRPEADAELLVGPWRFVGVEHRFEPVPVGDDRTWRGQVLRAADDDKLGLMVYATSAWRPDVDGFLFGAAGQSGQGYTPQLESAFPGATAAWATESQADVWIQGLAQQGSAPPAMFDYLDALRAGGVTEVIWASDAVHAGTSHENWHEYVRDRAPDAGVPAIFAVGHPRVGSYFAQAASGMRTDDAHFSSYGSLVIAQAWLDQLRELVGPICPEADYNGDGAVDVFDLLTFQTDWDARDPRADLDGDGEFTIFDFLVLLTAMDQCV
jgi:hypothetical protein